MRIMHDVKRIDREQRNRDRKSRLFSQLCVLFTASFGLFVSLSMLIPEGQWFALLLLGVSPAAIISIGKDIFND